MQHRNNGTVESPCLWGEHVEQASSMGNDGFIGRAPRTDPFSITDSREAHLGASYSETELPDFLPMSVNGFGMDILPRQSSWF